MAFDIYKRKFPEQPFPRKHVKSFDTIDEVMAFLGLSQDQTVSALEGEEVQRMNEGDKVYAVELNLPFLGEGMKQENIAQKIGVPHSTIRKNFERAINKLNKTGKLRPLLESIQTLRSHQYKEMRYSEKITIEV